MLTCKNFLKLLCVLSFFCLKIEAIKSQTINTMYGVVDETLVEIDPVTATTITIAPLVGVPTGVTINNLVYSTSDCIFYAIMNRVVNPALVSIDITGVFTVIGNITITGGTIFFVDALAYNEFDDKLYAAGSLNGDVPFDYESESILEVNPMNGNSTLVTSVPTAGSTLILGEDLDNMTFIGNVLYFHDGRAPTANMSAIFSLDFNNLSPVTSPTFVYNLGGWIGVRDLTSIANSLYFTTINFDLLEYNVSIGSFSNLGMTHTSPTYNGEAIQGIAYVDDTKNCTNPPIPIALTPKVFLQGPYSGSNMVSGIASRGLIPNLTPYGDGKMTSNTVLMNMIDWVFIEIRDAATGRYVLEGQSGLLLPDGTVVDVDGVSPLIFIQVPGDYHIVVKHRNHLGIMTKNPVTLN